MDIATRKELFVDALTGESIERELTAGEIAALPTPAEEALKE